MLSVLWGSITLGVDHLTGPIAAQTKYKNTDVEHATARGKPQVQEIGQERDEQSFSFFFDETFCDVELQHARLLAAYRSRSSAPLVIPGAAFRGALWRIETLDVTTKATTASGRLVRIEASVTMKEVPRSLSGVVSIGLAFAGRVGLGLSVRVN